MRRKKSCIQKLKKTKIHNKTEKIMNLKILLLLITATILQTNCTTEPGEETLLSLSVEEVSSTEAWIKLSKINTITPVNVSISRNEEEIFYFTLTKRDTVLYDEGLLPNKTYNYDASIKSNSRTTSVTATTLDTTSHNFSWQTFTFGEHSSSYLNDVAIIDENNIWAVGAIYLKDSLGQPDQQPYSLAKWDGKKWELKKLFYNSNSIITSIRGILVLNPNNIWLAAGSIFHWDGVSSQADLSFSRLTLPKPDATIEKLWGSENFIYGIGNAGTIVRYTNGNWQKIESGIDLPIQDIWGTYNEETDDYDIMCIASDKYYGGGPELFNIKNNNIISQSIEGLSWSISSIWFKNRYKAYIVGDGVFVRDYPNDKWANIINNITTYYMHSISGNGLNDIFIAGSQGDISHFNGSTWENYLDNQVSGFNGNLYKITVEDNIVCAVGTGQVNGHQAVIVFGRR